MTRRVLTLVLLLTQAATTVAGPAFTLCISPKGRVCIDAPWTICTCCQDDDVAEQIGQTQDVVNGNEEKICHSEKQCSCRCGIDALPSSATIQDSPSATDASTARERPCRCKHIPLIVTQDGQQSVVERTSVNDRHSLDLMPAPETPSYGEFSTTRYAVSLLPQPPPSAHLLAISSTVLRC